jgi:3-(methylthio)propanoyl-CoA dehydrogenase
MASTVSNFFLDNDDLLFQFKRGLSWEEIVDLTEAGYTLPDGPKNLEEALTFYQEVMTAAGEFAAKEVAPRAARIDQKGTHLKEGEVQFSEELEHVYDRARELGLYGVSIPRELGGSNCPLAVYFLSNEVVARADVSVMTHVGFHGGIAATMLLYAMREGSAVYENGRLVRSRFDGPIREIVEGRNFGCMVLTEPGAGSDLAALKARAVQRDGRWYINGEKIFITSGHGEYQLVLAKTEEEKASADGMGGLKAISLFLVPRHLEKDGARVRNVQLTKVEEKLGHHGSATVALLYEDSQGELIGRRGEGFDYMLALMNSARINVGFESIGLAEGAWRQARAYAQERWSMGKPLDQHELVAEKLLEMQAWIAGLRALGVEALNALEISQRLELKLKLAPPKGPEELARLKTRQQKLARRARRLTPLLKYLAAEKAVEIARDAVQIHGGMGYIDETGVHKFLRDAMVLPIYEGTSQIQALMATKDHLLWTARDPGGFLRRYTRARVLARTANSPLMREVHRAESYIHRTTETIMLRIFGRKLKGEWEGIKGKEPAAWGRYLTRDFLRRWDVKADFSHGLLHAERLTRMLADVAISKVLAQQAERFPERRALAEYFVPRAVLRVEALGREIEQSDDAVFKAIAASQQAQSQDRTA